MKSKGLKIILGVMLSIIVLALGFFAYICFTQPITIRPIKEFNSSGSPELSKVLSKEEVNEDIDNIIDIMEISHPIFAEEVPEGYYSSKNKLLSIKGKSITVAELQNEVSRYLSSIDDGHTALWWKEIFYIDVKWKYANENLILIDENNNLTNKKVIKIGDLDINTVIKVIEETFPAENYIAEYKNIERYAKGKSFLESVGVNFSNGVNITFESEDGQETLELEFTKEIERNYEDSIYINKINEDTAYIKLGTCEVNEALEGVVQETNKYLNEGIINFIVDVSDNSGGNSEACSMILEALKMKHGEYGSVIRFSPLAQEQRGYIGNNGYMVYDSSNESVKNEYINLYVLTNENTFSSAQMLAVWTRDGNLGTIIGRPSSNMPSSFGDILSFQLENSKLAGKISHKKWTRPDISKDKERVLEPDIYVESSENLLEKALEEIKNKN